MTKRRASINSAQFDFFDVRPLACGEADLAGLDRTVAAKVAQVLKDDGRSRHEIAGAMSALLDDPVSKMMLDGYAAESREQHNISFGRLLALIAVTKRADIADMLLRRIGLAVLTSDELRTAELGHLRAQERAIKAKIKRVENGVAPIMRGQRGADR